MGFPRKPTAGRPAAQPGPDAYPRPALAGGRCTGPLPTCSCSRLRSPPPARASVALCPRRRLPVPLSLHAPVRRHRRSGKGRLCHQNSRISALHAGEARAGVAGGRGRHRGDRGSGRRGHSGVRGEGWRGGGGEHLERRRSSRSSSSTTLRRSPATHGPAQRHSRHRLHVVSHNSGRQKAGGGARTSPPATHNSAAQLEQATLDPCSLRGCPRKPPTHEPHPAKSRQVVVWPS